MSFVSVVAHIRFLNEDLSIHKKNIYLRYLAPE